MIGKILGFALQAAIAYYTPTKADDVVVAVQGAQVLHGIVSRNVDKKYDKKHKLVEGAALMATEANELTKQIGQSEEVLSELEKLKGSI